MQSKSRKSILLSGYYGYSNVGDDLLLHTLVSYLNEEFHIDIIRATIKNPSAISEEIFNQISIVQKPNFSRFKIIRILQIIKSEINELKNNDILIYGGGTRLFETSNRTYQTFLIKYLVLQYNALFLKRKIIHLGVGIGDIRSKRSNWFLKRILSLSDHILLRDKKSYNKALYSIGSQNKIALGYDLMFLRQNIQNEPIQVEKRKIKVGLNFFHYYGYISDNVKGSEEFQKSVLKICTKLLSYPEIELYLFSFQKDLGGKDEKFHDEILKVLKNDRMFHFKYTIDTESIIYEMNQMDYCAGMRFHFCLLSLYSNIPTIGINYQPKVRNEYEDLELRKYCVEMENIEKVSDIIFYFINENEKTQINFSKAFKKINERRNLIEKRVSLALKPHLNSVKTP